MRHIVLHNHLFKNAGTSVDHILQQNFKTKWISAEFKSEGFENTNDLEQLINANPQAVAFSSHTIRGPLPQMKGVQLIPIVLLRDPVDRIASAYRFERVQDANTRGALLARQNGFAGYVHARQSIAGDRQCQNFQTSRLADLAPEIPGGELARACHAATVLMHRGVLGFVSDFDNTMDRLGSRLKPHFPSFSWQPVVANTSRQNGANSISPEMRKMLLETNQDDVELLRYVKMAMRQASTRAEAAHVTGMV